MPRGPFQLPKPKMPPSPLEPIKNMIRDSRSMIENAGSDVRSLANELHTSFPSTAKVSPQEPLDALKTGPQPPSNNPGPSTSKLTSEETLAYQDREIGRELWMLEKHLAQGCRIPDSSGKRIPCDCCQKGSFISALAYEAVPIAERASKTSSVYDEVAKWSEELEPKVTVEAIESGKYDYKKLSGDASALRKKLMGSLSLAALLSPSDRAAVAGKAAKMLEEESI